MTELTNEKIDEIRELMKTEMFAAIEYGRINNEVTQNALEASWYNHLEDIMEYIEDYCQASIHQAEIKAGIEAFTHAIDIVTANADDEDMENRLNDLFQDEIKERISALEKEIV